MTSTPGPAVVRTDDVNDFSKPCHADPTTETVMQIIPGDLTDHRVIGLLRVHLANSRAPTEPGAQALDLDGLLSPTVSFWTAWSAEALVAMGALRQLSDDHGELKSMRTAAAAQRTGAGTLMLLHIISVARSRGISRLSLETGAGDYFRPAVAFYRKHGFVECPPFAGHVPDPSSIFMTLNLHGR